MADVLPINFPVPTEAAIASYDYRDIASKTGYVIFYLGKTVDKNVLTENAFFSDTTYTQAEGSPMDGTWVLQQDVDFDFTINMGAELEGTAIISVPIAVYSTSSTWNTSTYIIPKLRKYSGGVETDIASNQSRTISSPTATTWNDDVVTIDLTIPLTKFAAGDILRVTIEQWQNTSASAPGGAQVAFAHDPMNRTESTRFSNSGQTLSEIQIPFRIEL